MCHPGIMKQLQMHLISQTSYVLVFYIYGHVWVCGCVVVVVVVVVAVRFLQ